MSLPVDPIPADHPFDAEALLAHVSWVRRLAHGLVPADPQLADDLAQQTYLVALEKKPSTDRSLSGWLATVLANLMRQERRGSGRRAVRERSVARPESQSADADHDATLALHQELVQSVMSLPEPYRQTIVLRYFEELSPTAIARKQNVPVATVKTRLARALDQLRGQLDRKHGGDGRAWIAALVPFARPESGAAALKMGALIVSTKLKIAAAAVVVLALVTVMSLWNSSIERADAPVAQRPRAATLAAPATTEPLDTRDSGSDRTTAPTNSTTVPATDLDLLVVDEDASPIADTPVMLLDAQDTSQIARTDAAGHAGFHSRPGRGALFLHRPDDAPRRVELETSAGARRVQLPQMAEVSGALRENGRPLAAPILVVMFSRERLFPGIELPEEVRNFLGLEDDEKYRPYSWTAPDGRFRFGGLPDSWSGRLVLPKTWAVSDSKLTLSGDQVVVLSVPVKDLVIEVEHRSHLSGRIVDANHRPAERAKVNALLEWSKHGSEKTEAISGPDGRFELPIAREELERVTLDVVGGEAIGTTKLVRKRAEILSSFDLGDIVLAAGSTLRLHVTDAEGRPIAGALAFAEKFNVEAKTDAKGDCVLTNVPAIAQRVRVIAQGCWGATVPLPISGPDPVTLVLQPCNKLTIRTLGPDGRPPGSIRIAISSGSVALYPETGSHSMDKILPERMTGRLNGTVSDRAGGEESLFTPDGSGTFAIEALVPGVPLRVRVQDSVGRIAREITVPPLGVGEHRDVEIALDRAARPIRGAVHDETGAPVAGARVEASAERGVSLYGDTDGEGRFELDPTFADAIELGVRKEGFALFRKGGIRLQDPPADLAITLERGRRVQVSVVDSSAHPVDTGNLSVFDPQSNSGWPSRTLGPGLFEVVGLPAHEIELRLYLSGKQYVQVHDPRVPEALIEVPVHGRVVVSWSTDMTERHAVTLASKDSTLGELSSLQSERPNGEAVFESVLPGEWHVSLVTVLEGKQNRKVPQETITVQPGATVRVNLSD